ncbi:hypothetical protein [Phenylobacterium sp.]|jgi:hypothetical protein|uniref:hypothetical protein n=1 Tax=Phenylobacterium sp. TaxID=1871053 RepID=UPI0037C5B7F2
MALKFRNIAVIASVAFAIAVPALQMGLGLGLSAKDFAGQGDSTLRAAPYAFSIWSVIYLGLIAYAVWQALPRNRGDRALASIGWPSVIAIAGCGVWIIASSANWQWASVGIIFASAGALTWGLIRKAPRRRNLPENLLAWWPLALLAGWLTIASAINLLTVLTAQGLIAGESARIAGFGGVITVLLIAVSVLRAPCPAVYGVPIAWGLVAVWAAEQAPKPQLAVLAMVSAVIVGGYALWRGRQSAAQA